MTWYLPQITRRTFKGVKSDHEKKIDDILENIKPLDAKYWNESFPMTSVSGELNKVSNVKPEETETVSLLNQVYRLER